MTDTILHPINDPLAENFQLFMQAVWKHLELPSPTRIQYDIAYFLQHGPKRRMIEAFRGIGKTWITTAYAAWRLYCNPQIKVLIVSAGGDHADNTAIFLKRLIDEMPLLAFLKPQAHQRSANVQFDVGPSRAAQTPSVRSVGITGQMTGGRADLIIADDIETPTNSATQMMREKIANAVKEFASVLKPDAAAEVIYLGTPQVEDSLYNKLPERGYIIRIWPARYPDKKLLDVMGDNLAPTIRADLLRDTSLEGKPTEPTRFSDFVLIEKEAEMGRSTFQLQMMLNTALSDAERYPLKLSDLIFLSTNNTSAPQKVIWASSPDLVLNTLPNVGMTGDRMHRPMHIHDGNWLDYTGSIMTIDPSGRGKDETAYAVLKILNGYIYLLDVGGFIDGYSPDTLDALANKAKEYGVNRVLWEGNYGGGMFGALFKPILLKIYPTALEEISSKGQKEIRVIDILEPVLNQHKLIVNMNLVDKDFKSVDKIPTTISKEHRPAYRFFYQLTRITKDKGSLRHDDRVEAVAMGVSFFTQALSKDPDKSIEAEKERALMKEFEGFKQHIFGPNTGRRKNWVN